MRRIEDQREVQELSRKQRLRRIKIYLGSEALKSTWGSGRAIPSAGIVQGSLTKNSTGAEAFAGL